MQELCETFCRHNKGISKATFYALELMNGIRRWTFLPALVSTVGILVSRRGGDSFSVLMNTAAVLVLTQIDNVTCKLKTANFCTAE